jgi:hypothetical protein
VLHAPGCRVSEALGIAASPAIYRRNFHVGQSARTLKNSFSLAHCGEDKGSPADF